MNEKPQLYPWSDFCLCSSSDVQKNINFIGLEIFAYGGPNNIKLFCHKSFSSRCPKNFNFTRVVIFPYGVLPMRKKNMNFNRQEIFTSGGPKNFTFFVIKFFLLDAQKNSNLPLQGIFASGLTLMQNKHKLYSLRNFCLRQPEKLQIFLSQKCFLQLPGKPQLYPCSAFFPPECLRSK